MTRRDTAAVLVTASLLPLLAGCASLGTSSAASPVAPGGVSSVEPRIESPTPAAPAEPTAATPQATAASPLTGDDTAEEIFEEITETITVDGTEFHQIRFTPAADGRPADVMYGTDQWEAHLVDNTQPIGPIIVVHVTERSQAEIVKMADVPASEALLASKDPFTPVEPGSDSPSGQEQRLVVLPPPAGSGGVVFAATGVSDADVRAFAEAVTE